MKILLRNKFLRIGILALFAAMILFGFTPAFVPSYQHVAYAAFNNEPFEFENY